MPSLAPLLQVFSNEGQFKFRFGVRGRSPGQLQRPTGVAVDTNGDIIVADYDNRWVSIFSPEGKFKVRRSLLLLCSEPLVTCSEGHATRLGPEVVYHQLKILL